MTEAGGFVSRKYLLRAEILQYPSLLRDCSVPRPADTGVIWEMYAFFVLQSVLSLGGKVNTRRMSQPDMESIFTKIIYEIFWSFIGNYYENFQNYLNLMLLSSSDTRRTLMHLFFFTNSAHRELVSICTQSIRERNKLSLHNNLDQTKLLRVLLWIVHCLICMVVT